MWTETHSLLFPLQQTVLQMSSIIPPSLPSHSSTLSHAIMAIALSGVLFPLLVKFFPMTGEFPITGHKAKNARHVFFPTSFAAWLRSCDEAPPIRSPTSQATLWVNSPSGSLALSVPVTVGTEVGIRPLSSVGNKTAVIQPWPEGGVVRVGQAVGPGLPGGG